MKYLDANGANIPAIGLGTFRLQGEQCTDMVQQALNHGYQHIDTAAFYDNEEAIGAGIRASGVPRENIFLTTKVWPSEVADGSFQKSVEASLSRLGLDYIDLLLIHWPPQNRDVRNWATLLSDAADRGWTRNIGVSNFTSHLLRDIIEASDRPIAVNQVENHPYIDQSKLRSVCAQNSVAFVAYCPLYKAGEVFNESAVQTCADKYGRDPAQITLRWHIQHDGAGAIPKTATPDRMKSNIDVFDFELSDDEMAAISNLTSKNSRLCDMDGISPQWDAV